VERSAFAHTHRAQCIGLLNSLAVQGSSRKARLQRPDIGRNRFSDRWRVLDGRPAVHRRSHAYPKAKQQKLGTPVNTHHAKQHNPGDPTRMNTKLRRSSTNLRHSVGRGGVHDPGPRFVEVLDLAAIKKLDLGQAALQVWELRRGHLHRVGGAATRRCRVGVGGDGRGSRFGGGGRGNRSASAVDPEGGGRAVVDRAIGEGTCHNMSREGRGCELLHHNARRDVRGERGGKASLELSPGLLPYVRVGVTS